MSAPAPALRWSHVALNCTDPGATEEFYRRWFGFSRARVVPLGDEQIVFLRNQDVYLEIFRADGPGGAAGAELADGPKAPGVTRHLAFQTDDVDAFLTGLEGRVPVTLGPLDFDDFLHGWRSVWLLDPDGVVVEVSQGYRDQRPDEIEEATP